MLVDIARLAEPGKAQTWYSIYKFANCFTLNLNDYNVIDDLCVDSSSLAMLFKKCNVIMTDKGTCPEIDHVCQAT